MMKIFELMSELSKLPAGLEVKVNGCMSEIEFKENAELMGIEDGVSIHSVGGSCIEVANNEKDVFLYFEP